MRILVTGGAGYVGSVCVRRLCQAGHEVTVVDDLSAGHAAAVLPPARLVKLNLLDREALLDLVRTGRFEAAMHFAASTAVGESVAKPLEYWRNNVLGSWNLLDALKQGSVGVLVFSSTCAVYGEPRQLPLKEDHLREPVSPYGRSKAAVEWMLEDSARGWGLAAVALRYFNAAGAADDGSLGEDHDPETHLIPLVLRAAMGLRPALKIFGTDWPTPDGTCIRDYIHVEDLAEAHLLALEAAEVGSVKFFNVGTGTGHSVREVIQAAERVTGLRVPAEPAGRRPGDVPILQADASLSQRDLGWRAKRAALEQIVDSAWRWLKAHPTGYDG